MKTAVYFEHNFPTWKTMILGAFLGLSVASCADQNFDWEEARNQNPEYTFRSNFEKLVGTIDPDQSWDFSTSAFWETRALATRAEATPSTTISVTEYTGSNKDACGIKSGDTGFDADGWYYVQNDNTNPESTIQWLNTNLPEGTKENRKKGSPFSMLMPETGSFTIVPIYQGQAGHRWKLEVVEVDADGTEHSKYIWRKYENVQYKCASEEKTDWTNLGGYDADGNSWENRNGTMNVDSIRVKAYTISGIAKGKEIYFRLYNVNESKYVTSKQGNMVILACPRPTNLDSTHEVRILGCEDRSLKPDPNNTSSDYGDDDMNDVVFMIIGNPTVPKEEILTSKRYMVEDLGSTAESDIDFNDIVIDIESRQPGYNRYNEDTKTSEFIKEGAPKQRARVMALGGTIDFYFLLKNTDGTYKNIYHKAAYKDYKKMLNTDAATMSYTTPETDWFDISGWDPTTNNVAFLVCRDRNVSLDAYVGGDTEGCYISNDGQVTLNGKNLVTGEGPLSLIDFPQTGETPFIVAFDTDKQWRDERHKICSHWLYGTKKNDGKKCSVCGEE